MIDEAAQEKIIPGCIGMPREHVLDHEGAAFKTVNGDSREWIWMTAPGIVIFVIKVIFGD